MKKHNFVYNYGFIADWLKANPQIKRYDVLGNLSMSDYRTLQNWMEGLTMMPLTQMMRFCNIYGIPITAFFYDEYADDSSIFTPLSPDAMIEPSGGWRESDRRAGIKVCDPRTEHHIESRLPKYVRDNLMLSATENVEEDLSVTHDERMKYLDVIKGLSDRMMELSRENTLLRDKIIELERQDRGFAFAADHPVVHK